MSSVRRISSGSIFEEQVGYSRAVVAGDHIFVAGTTGFNYQTGEIEEGIVPQLIQCLSNIRKALEEAGASLDDVVRVTYLIPQAEDWPACWPILKDAFSVAKPAATMMVAHLHDPRMRVEVEVTAYKPSSI